MSTPSAVLCHVPYASGRDPRWQGTNPTELIAAAQVGSFAMTLAHELGTAGYTAARIDATATVTMEPSAAGWTMSQIHLDVTASVPRATQCDFIDAALRAKASCPVSRSLTANISIRAKLMKHRTGRTEGSRADQFSTRRNRAVTGSPQGQSRPVHRPHRQGVSLLRKGINRA